MRDEYDNDREGPFLSLNSALWNAFSDNNHALAILGVYVMALI